MKTFKEFLEEAYLNEMRKEDKVKGEKKTPLYKEVGGGRVERQPEGSDTKWRVRKSEKKGLSPRAATGRMKQGMKDPTNPYSGGIEMPGAARHAHGGGGSGAKAPGRLRGVKKVPGEKKGRQFGDAPTPAQKVALRRAKSARSAGGGDR